VSVSLLAILVSAPIALGVAEEDGLEVGEAAAILAQIDAALGRAGVVSRRAEVPAGCGDLAGCAADLARRSGGPALVLQLLRGALHVRVRAAYASEGAAQIAEVQARAIDPAAIDRLIGELPIAKPAAPPVTLAPPRQDPPQAAAGSAWPWLLVGASVAASGAGLALALTAPEPFTGRATPATYFSPEFAEASSQGTGQRVAAAVLLAGGGGLLVVSLLSMLDR
jgi:hypothetical protein